MSQDIRMEKVIQNYLEMDTSYALLINGPRGVGKTFFAKEKIQPLIRTVPVMHDQSKKYIPVYVSLYGIKSIDQVYTLLAIELIPFLKNKNVKLGLAITKLITRGAFHFKGGGDIDSYLKDLSNTKKTLLDTKDFVLLFDDLDRISESLEVGEVIGFINSLVEHENNKIIIIADDELLKSDPKYTAVKEKTIGTVIEYNADIAESYKAIIDSKYQATFGIYYAHLTKEKEAILHWFNISGTQNLRTLIYFLQHYQTIYSSLYSVLQDELKDKKIAEILRFSVAVAIEFKKGKLSFQRPLGINDMRAINLQISKESLKEAFVDNLRAINNNNPPAAPHKPYHEEFIATYFNNDYEFYAPVFNFITGGDTFDAEALVRELKKNFNDRVHRPKPQDVIFRKLSEPSVYDLSNQEYSELTDKMLAYAHKGAYPLDHYIAVVLYTQRFPEIKKYALPAEAYTLIDDLKANMHKLAYDDDLRDKFEDSHPHQNKKLFQDLWKALNEINNSIRQAQIEKNRFDLFIEFQQDPDQFYLKANELPDVPILATWDIEKFITHFQQMPASQIPRFRHFLKKRYAYGIRERVEYFFINSLFDAIQKVNPDEPKNLRRIALDRLGALLQEIIQHNAGRHEQQA